MKRKMFSRRGVLACLAAAPLAGLRHSWAAATKSIVARDFGAVPDGSDAGPGFARACSEIASAGGGKLIVPPGVYSFAASEGFGLGFSDLDMVSVEATGAVFMFRGLCRPLVFRNCRRISVQGLTIDWSRPPFSQGDVVHLEDGGRVAEIELDAATPMDGWSKIEAIGGYDRAANCLSRRRVDAYIEPAAIEPLSARRVRLRFRQSIGIGHADTLVLRHAIYEAHAIEFARCGDVVLDNVTVRAAPGMAFVGSHCRNIRIADCVVAPDPQGKLLMSTTADAAHFVDCEGEIIVDKCRFAQMGDDGLNVNTSYWRVVERKGDDAIIISQRADLPFEDGQGPSPGERVAFASGQTLEVLDEETLADVLKTAASNHRLLRLNRAASKEIKAGDVLYDENRLAKLNVRACVFADNRAHGVIARRNASISDCQFLNQSLQGVLLAPSLFWLEGPEVSNVVVENNLFDGVDRWGERKGAIYVGAEIIGDDQQPHTSRGFPNHDIAIRNNVFRNLEGEPVVAYATRK